MKQRRPDRRSAAAAAYRNWYKSKLWLRRRAEQLARQPLCERHKRLGVIVAATVANHKIPHRGNWTLFATGELESTCAHCHDSVIQSEEASGYLKGCNIDGRPLDPGHPWNSKK